MKLYIPTSSLNAENILSCESIVPANECIKRSFGPQFGSSNECSEKPIGYSWFKTLKELQQFKNVTLVFTKIPKFEINDPNLEDYPMVVEIEVADTEKVGLELIGEKADTKIYASANPILVSPTTTHLLFFKEKDLKNTKNNCSVSAKCKLFEFFKPCFAIVPQSESEIGEQLTSYTQDLKIPKILPSYSENSYDKAKGFIWGFGLGTLLSMTPKTAQLLKIQKRIYDIISSTKADGAISNAFMSKVEELDSEYTQIERRFAKSKWEEHINQIITSSPELFTVSPTVIDFLFKKFEVENEAKTKFLERNQLSLHKPLSSYSKFGYSGLALYRDGLTSHTKSAMLRDKQDCSGELSFSNILDVDLKEFKSVRMKTTDELSRLFNNVLDRIIWCGQISSLEKIRTNRQIVASDVVTTLKGIIEDGGMQWKDSDFQSYFHRMRKNISKSEPFYLNDEKINLVLQSVAAFVLKGEDFDSLKSYLEINAVPDYRYAFALWGAIIGYVSIPRTLIESCLSSQETVKLHKSALNALGFDEEGVSLRSAPESNEPIPIPPSIVISYPDKGILLKASQVLSYFDNIKGIRDRKKLREGLEKILPEGEGVVDGCHLLEVVLNEPG